MAVSLRINLGAIRTGLSTVQAKVYSASALVATVALSEAPASSGQYVGSTSAATSGLFGVLFDDSSTSEIYGHGEFWADGSGDEVQLGSVALAAINTQADTALSDYGALRPTTAGRTLDVTAAGNAGIDWGNVESPTATLNLSGTTVATLSGHTPQTGDAFARLGAPAGASVSADIAAVKSQTGAIETDTQDIQNRLPAALVSGRMDSSVGAIASGAIVEGSFGTGAITATVLATDALGSLELSAAAVTEIVNAINVSGINLTITPVQVNAANPRYSTRNLAPVAQGSAPTDILTITDGTGTAINLSGKTLRLVVASVADEGDEEDDTDDSLTPLYKYETGGSGLTVGGGSNNQVTIQHDADNTATAGNFRYWLWNVTDNIVLTKGTLKVEPAEPNYP